MNNDVAVSPPALPLLAGLFLLLFLAAELLYRLVGVPAEVTRKFVHIGTGLLTLLFPHWLTAVWQAGLLCGSFLVLLLLSIRQGWLPSIHAIHRRSHGSLLYPVAVFGAFCFFRAQGALAAFYLPVLILAICDPIAALAGKSWQRRTGATGGKSAAGSIAFFGAALAIGILIQWIFNRELLISSGPAETWLLCLALAAGCSLAERWAGNGWDNLTIPAAAIAILYLSGTFCS